MPLPSPRLLQSHTWSHLSSGPSASALPMAPGHLAAPRPKAPGAQGHTSLELRQEPAPGLPTPRPSPPARAPLPAAGPQPRGPLCCRPACLRGGGTCSCCPLRGGCAGTAQRAQPREDGGSQGAQPFPGEKPAPGKGLRHPFSLGWGDLHLHPRGSSSPCLLARGAQSNQGTLGVPPRLPRGSQDVARPRLRLSRSPNGSQGHVCGGAGVQQAGQLPSGHTWHLGAAHTPCPY